MTKWITWTSKQEAIWEMWVKERPPVIQEMIAAHQLRPDNLYILTTTGYRVVLHSFDEDGTVKVHVLLQYNPEKMVSEIQNRTVFGINPADLKLCEDWTEPPVNGTPYEDLADENESEGKTIH